MSINEWWYYWTYFTHFLHRCFNHFYFLCINFLLYCNPLQIHYCWFYSCLWFDIIFCVVFFSLIYIVMSVNRNWIGFIWYYFMLYEMLLFDLMVCDISKHLWFKASFFRLSTYLFWVVSGSKFSGYIFLLVRIIIWYYVFFFRDDFDSLSDLWYQLIFFIGRWFRNIITKNILFFNH